MKTDKANMITMGVISITWLGCTAWCGFGIGHVVQVALDDGVAWAAWTIGVLGAIAVAICISQGAMAVNEMMFYVRRAKLEVVADDSLLEVNHA